MKAIKLNDAIDKDIQKGTPERDDFDNQIKRATSKPQSESTIWIVPIIGLCFGIAVIVWFSIVHL